MTMRVFFLLLIFAIGFSGYSAAAHTFGPDSCNPAMKAEPAMDQGMDMFDCPSHQADKDKQIDNDQSKSSKAKCMHCTHCCASHAMNLPEYSMNFQQQATVLDLPPTAGIDGDYLMSLLRPPKSLV